MRIGVDIDGVIADFVGSFLPRLNEVCTCGFDQIVSHDFRNNVCVDEALYKELWNEEVENGKIYEHLSPLPYVCEALQYLAEHHEIFVISSRKENSRQATGAWLRRYGMPFAQLQLAKNKREKVEMMIRCDLIIEDELDIARMVEAKGVPVILFDYPWTKVGQRITRVTGWDEAVKEIGRIVAGHTY